jgi:hypothetical protein
MVLTGDTLPTQPWLLFSWPDELIQDTVDIIAQKLTLQCLPAMDLKSFSILCNITDTANMQVPLVCNVAERSLIWGKLEHKQNENFLKAEECPSQVRRMIKCHQLAQR